MGAGTAEEDLETFGVEEDLGQIWHVADDYGNDIVVIHRGRFHGEMLVFFVVLLVFELILGICEMRLCDNVVCAWFSVEFCFLFVHVV